MKFRTKETSQRIALLEACKSARVALVEWEKLCQEFVPGHVKLRPEYSDCEVGSYQAQVSIRQAINLCEVDDTELTVRPTNPTKALLDSCKMIVRWVKLQNQDDPEVEELTLLTVLEEAEAAIALCEKAGAQ